MPSIAQKYSALIFTKLAATMQEQSFKKRHRRFSRYFTRKRILSFVDLVVIQVNRMVLSLSVELSNFLDLIGLPGNFSKQAFSQARQNLLHTAFIELQEEFIQNYYSYKKEIKLYQDKYLLLAGDSSLIQLPDSKELANYFGCWKNQKQTKMALGRLSVLHDILNDITLGGKFSPHSVGERKQFFQIYDRLKDCKVTDSFSSLYLLDRGYPSFELCKTLDMEGKFFVIRSKASFCNEVKMFVEEDIGEKAIYLSPRSWHKDGRFKESIYKEGLHLRIVRILLPSGEYEYLLIEACRNPGLSGQTLLLALLSFQNYTDLGGEWRHFMDSSRRKYNWKIFHPKPKKGFYNGSFAPYPQNFELN